ncbi:MAG: GerW family sporulation protein [Clostridium sp.]
MAENHFTSTIESLFKGMDQFVTTKTVVGEPVQVGETIIIPLIDVTCGMAAGALQKVQSRKTKAVAE